MECDYFLWHIALIHTDHCFVLSYVLSCVYVLFGLARPSGGAICVSVLVKDLKYDITFLRLDCGYTFAIDAGSLLDVGSTKSGADNVLYNLCRLAGLRVYNIVEIVEGDMV